MQYLMLIYCDESGMSKVTPEQLQGVITAYGAFTNEVKEKKVYLGGNPLHPDSDRDHRPRARRQDHDHGWPVRRDEGATGRLLPARLQRSRRGFGVRREDPRRGLWGSIEVRPIHMFMS